HRVILGTTRPGEIVLDPFFGAGTTGAVAKKLGRRFIGIERDKGYVKAAKKRIAAIDPAAPENLVVAKSKKEEPRVPFGLLIEQGFINPGDMLVSPDGRIKARVRADGSLAIGEFVGSIHRAGAHATNAPACNGWTFWHRQTADRGLESIDLFRRAIRSKMGA
ncbi:MAG: DNA methyltransferase, partial [Hyphomonadaceae bacterium]